MNKYSTLLILLVLCIIYSCHRKRDLPGFDTDVIIPLANASIGLDKIISDSAARVNADHSLDLVYRYPFYEYSLKDILKVPDTSVIVSAKLGTLNLSNSILEQRITLFQIASNMGFTGQIIIASNGQNAQVPPLAPSVINQKSNIDALNFFQEADLTDGNLDLTLVNELPIPISDLDFNVKNKVGGQLIFSDTFSLIPAGASITRTYSLAGKHVEGTMEGTLVTIGSPGSGGQAVPIDISKAIVLQLKVRDLKASHAIAKFPKQDLIVVDDTVLYDLGKPQIKKMLIRSGKVRMQLFSTLQDTLYIDYKIPSAIKDNDTVHLFLKVPPALPNQVQNVIQEVDLTGYTINMTGRSGLASNSFWNIFKASIDSSKSLIPLSTSDSVWIKYGLYDIIPQFAEGYLGQDLIDIGPTKSTIDAFSRIVGGSIDLKDINLTLSVDNGIGADATLNFDYLTSKNTKKGNTIALNSPALTSPFVVARATRLGYAAKFSTSTLPINTSNSNIKAFVENLPDEVNYKFTAKINPNGNLGFIDFIDYDSKLVANLDVQMPLAFKADHLAITDTAAFSIGNTQNTTGIDKGKINFIFENDYPLSLGVKLYFLNSYDQMIDSVFDGSGAIISEGVLDLVTQRTSSPSKTILSVYIDNARYDKLKGANRVIIKAFINTNGSNHIKLYSDYKLKLKLTGEFTYHAGKR